MKQSVNPFDYAGHICQSMKKGVLMTTKSGEKVNTMTIGWGTMGIEWGKPVFVAYVRKSRYTRSLLDENGEFTVNIPMGDLDRNILGYCGTRSGRDTDKIADLGLILEQPDQISVPGIRQLPLTLECRVLFRNAQDEAGIPQDICQRYYSGVNEGDFHFAYYAEIVGAYLITD